MAATESSGAAGDAGSEPMLTVDSLSVSFYQDGEEIEALRDVSLSLEKGETLGIVGESGSGKSTLAYAILQYLDENGEITEGSITFQGREMTELSPNELRSIRGNDVAHVAQNASVALNPNLTIGEQIKEAIELHQSVSSKEANRRVIEVLEKVNIADPDQMRKQYVHELSGGQQQRALVACALSCNPNLLILDEPTTGLDVTTQAKILDLVEDLKTEADAAILIITHNLGVISEIADRVNILYAGEMMEKAPTDVIFDRPSNPYTQGLLATIPELDKNKDLKPIPGQIPDLAAIPDGCIFADRCALATEECRVGDIPMDVVDAEFGQETRCIHWQQAVDDPIVADMQELADRSVATRSGGEPIMEVEGLKKYYDQGGYLDSLMGHKPVRAVDGVDFEIREGETFALVGESGCGKSTIGRILVRLLDPTEGQIKYKGQPISALNSAQMKEFRSECQIVFQDPESSLNPRKRIRQILSRPLVNFTDLDEDQRVARIEELLTMVNLPVGMKSKFPHELSGGEKQRIAIARAFAVNPSVVVLDEPLSALDVSVQASVVNLLEDLGEEHNSSYMIISHDLSLVEAISDRIGVMYLGNLVELGEKSDVFGPPHHPYTKALLSSVPRIDPELQQERIRLEGDVPSPRNPPDGCRFHTRCPQKIGEPCEATMPDLDERGPDHWISCLLETDELS